MNRYTDSLTFIQWRVKGFANVLYFMREREKVRQTVAILNLRGWWILAHFKYTAQKLSFPYLNEKLKMNHNENR